MKQPLRYIGFVVGLAIVGCSTPEPRLGENSRSGYVSKIYTAEALMRKPPTCLTSLTPQQLATNRFVEVMIPHGRLHEYITVSAPRSISLEVHDKVEFSPRDCHEGIVPAILQNLTLPARPEQ